jgi:hypothetical protein
MHYKTPIQPFKEPEGYFDDLSGRIQQRIQQKNASFQAPEPGTSAWYWRLAFPSLALCSLVIALVFRPQAPSSILGTQWNQLAQSNLIEWVEQENLYDEFTLLAGKQELEQSLSFVLFEHSQPEENLQYLEEELEDEDYSL